MKKRSLSRSNERSDSSKETPLSHAADDDEQEEEREQDDADDDDGNHDGYDDEDG